MAKLPSKEALGQRPDFRPDTSVRSGGGEAAAMVSESGRMMGGAFGQLGEATYQVDERRKDEQGQFDYARARAAFLSANVAAVNGFEGDQDYGTFEQRYTEQMAQARADAAGMIGNPDYRARFEAETQVDQARGLADVSGMARAKAKDAKLAAGQTTLYQLRDTALAAKDQPTKYAALTTMQGVIDGLAADGTIGAADAVTMRRKNTIDYAQSSLEMLPPEERLKILSGQEPMPGQPTAPTVGSVVAGAPRLPGAASSTGTVADFLPPDVRQEMQAKAQDEIYTTQLHALTLQEHADSHAEKQIKVYGDDIARKGYELFNGGQLSQEWIRQATPFLQPAEVKGFYEMLKTDPGAPTRDDPAALAELETMISGGEDISQSALTFMQRDQLKPDTYQSYMSKNRAALADTQPKSPYQQGLDYVRTSLDPAMLSNSSPAAQQALRISQAGAIMEFNNWSAKNKSAPPADIQAEAMRIAKSHWIVDFSNMSIGLGVPRFYQGGRSSLQADPAAASTGLHKAEDETLEALKNGTMSKEQANQELQQINDWRAVISRQKAGQ